MAKNLSMPRLSDTMEVGTIVKWHVKPGQKVRSGDVVADIETDKATMELQTFDDGTVGELAVNEGQSVPVGTLILKWEGGEVVPASTAKGAQATAAASAPAKSAAITQAVPVAQANGSPERVFASPLARKIAGETGIDLKTVQGTGPSGRIVRKDVETFVSGGAGVAGAASPQPAVSKPPAKLTPSSPSAAAVVPGSAFTHSTAPLQGRVVPLSNMRQTIAKRLVESKATIPHYQVTVSVRMDALLALRTQLNDQLAAQGVKLSVNDFLVRACALAMHQHPFVNSRWGSGGTSVEVLPAVNVGVAISLPEERGGGLVVATIRNADQLGLRLISQQTKALAEKARTKGLTIEEMSDSTFTISNLGMFGVEHFTAIINPPNAAILAVGAAVKKPVVETIDGKDAIVVGHEMQMTMSSDHRIVDGAMAAQYLASVKGMLEKPASLLV
ncbi:MAG: dihydrolipoamide acetyltransferase family protein [Phycisphaerales bacterium]